MLPFLAFAFCFIEKNISTPSNHSFKGYFMKIGRMRIIEIDMKAERDRIKNVDYTQEEKSALFELCELFEAGKFKEARTFISSWDKEWLEYIVTDIWYILNDPDYKVIDE